MRFLGLLTPIYGRPLGKGFEAFLSGESPIG
jgi:hypothetical protein